MDSNNVFIWVKAAVSAALGAFGAAFGWVGGLVLAWVGCMVLDYITGSAAAAAKGNWSSAVAREGIWHKGGMIAIVIVAAVTDCVLGVVVEHLPVLGLDYTVLVLPVILVWYIFTELGSVAENAADMGGPVSAWLKKLLAVSRQAAEIMGGEADEEDKEA